MKQSEAVIDIDSASQLLHQLSQAFDELESNKDAFSKFGLVSAEIKEHTQNLESSFRKRFNELEEREKAFEEKASSTRRHIDEREAEVVKKERASIDRIQELRDAAVDIISETRKKFKLKQSPKPDIKETSSSADGHSKEEQSTTQELKLHPKLKHLCEEMDAKGLLRFLGENKRIFTSLCYQIPFVLGKGNDLAQLVLDSLEVFNTPEGNQTDMACETPRRTCLLLMEALSASFDGEKPLSSEMREKIKAVAEEWNFKLLNSSEVDSMEAQALLQLLTTFNIAREFEEEKLCKLVLAACGRRQAAELCRSLGLDHKIPDVIEALIRSGRHIDGVHLIYAFQLTGRFSPVPLLREYLATNSSSSGPHDADAQELSTLRALIKCIEEYCLQSEYPLAPLQRRVADLKRAKGENGSYGPSKFRSRKPRSRSGGYFPRFPAGDFGGGGGGGGVDGGKYFARSSGGYSSPRFSGVDYRDDNGYNARFSEIAVDQSQRRPLVFDSSSSERYYFSGPSSSYNYREMPDHAPYEPTSYVSSSFYGPEGNYFPEEVGPTSSYGPSNYGIQGAAGSLPPKRSPYM